ncbi:MAG: tungsten ABC transporter substrate-binding protein [Candidatus Eisenbacteria bacterium]|nr:tungsten ABC transporter substrate-binding protein [Candidatus Eisenbacteria bacterium]
MRRTFSRCPLAVRRLALALACLATGLAGLTPGCGESQPGEMGPVRLATTTSTANTGLLDTLLAEFRDDTGIEVHYVAVGTGQALKHGENGDVDAVLVHAPEAEAEFLAAGFGLERVPLMWNDFVIAGPPADRAGIASAATAAGALQRIADSGAPFVSRGDDSGTHKKELQLWRVAGITPRGEAYVEAGQGMGACLTIAAEKEAYILTDRGTHLAMRDDLDLAVLCEGDPLLINPYSIIAIDPQRHADLHHAGAARLIAWLSSPRGQAVIGAYRVGGEQLFHPGPRP